MTDAAGAPRAEDVRERAEKLLARVGEYPPEPWCNDAITLVRDLLALPAAGSSVSPDPTDRAPEKTNLPKTEDRSSRLASSDRALHDENPAWLPTAANINALPDPVRRYIHDLETRCDPSGDIRELTIARDTCQQQDRAIAALRDERARIERVAKMVGESTDKANTRMMAAESRLAALQDAIREVVEDPLETRSVLTAWGRRLLTLLPGSGTGET